MGDVYTVEDTHHIFNGCQPRDWQRESHDLRMNGEPFHRALQGQQWFSFSV